MIKICNRIVEFSFYTLFLLVPLAFTNKTSELFELNKMWLTWGLTILITASWLIKMVLQNKILLRRTPLDIPIGLFLLSQIISTIFSLDSHTSLWGYYSRFNGGLFSIISYILLYYAFLSNFQENATIMVKRSLFLSLVSGLIVALWGLPSHFGYDPTCLLFRGTFDVSCWTQDFLPRVRIFSTLGQPNWLAAYLAILIPITIAFSINNLKSNSSGSQVVNHESGIMNHVLNKKFIHNSLFIILASLFYIDLLFTRAQSGFLGIWLALIFFFSAYFWMQRKATKSSFSIETLKSPLSILILGFLLITFLLGSPIAQLNGFTLDGITGRIRTIQAPKTPAKPEPIATTPAFRNPDEGGTESGDIRMLVWEGAINAWKANPLIGTGVETFAFAYYKYKPIGQNLTSEWNFLYNKAHNEYLNYLATTGIVGLGSYLLMIGSFLFLGIKALNSKHEAPNQKQSQNSNNKNSKLFGYSNFENSNLFRISNFEFRILALALIAAYVSILVTNFFGFSVVVTNIYLFMIPAFVFILIKSDSVPTGTSKTQTTQANKTIRVEIEAAVWSIYWKLTFISLILIIGIFMLYSLLMFWQADISYALGANLDRAGEYQQAFSKLGNAVRIRGGEPVFRDEYSLNNAIVATALITQKSRVAGIASGDARQDEKTQKQIINYASLLAQEAISVSNDIVSQYPNNAAFWKNRTRLFYTLAQADPRHFPRALDAITKASLLAPNDANIWYNLGILYGQNNNVEKGMEALERTIMLKPDYRDAHYALGLFYHTASLDAAGKIIIDSALQKKAIDQMQYILDNISAKDTDAQKSIDDWAK